MSDILEHFYIGAPYVSEDGTEDELRSVLIKHSQTNPKIIQKACKEISIYINFCMNITTSVFSLDRQQVRINLLNQNLVVYAGDEVSDPLLNSCLRLLERETKARYFPSDSDTERITFYGKNYDFLFSEMLDGVSYFPKE